ncbi:MAG: pectate lyase [Prevotella sp.]|nr:pectate lyase [Prevotella sp.]
MTVVLLFVATLKSAAAVTIQAADGWLETAWVEWINMSGAQAYNVYVSPAGQNSWTQLDNELVRNYGSYGRADALGLKAGNYQLKVVPVDSKGVELTNEASVTDALDVRAHNRQGFAHMNRPTSGWTEGVGAYKNDGTLKDDAVVLYVTAQNAKDITVNWPRYEGREPVTWTGLNNVIDGFRKCIDGGGMKKPLCIRIVGTVKKDDCDKMASSQGLHIKSQAQNEEHIEMPLTLEGVGNDATLYNFGMQISNAVGVEVRNLGILLCLDDGVEISRYNTNIWIHNMDLFYGQGGSGDKVKGDGAIDTKDSRYCTISANHYFDCGKCCLVDAGDTRATFYANNLTYCGNWFDHADQRLPRLRHGEAFHVYNNYYDGNGLYGVGLASASSAFVENNWFRNCRYPIVSSVQGSDLWHIADLKAKGTKSKGVMTGEEGGVCKAYNNHIEGATSYYNQHTATSEYGLDAYEVSSREEKVPSSIVAKNGGSTYSNFDTTDGEFYACTPLATEDVPAAVTGKYGAGRCQKGDFSWEFDNAVEDKNCELIPELKSAVQNYKSKLVGFYKNATPTGIRQLSIDKGQLSIDTPIYNLAGQKVDANYKGIVIKGNKKVVQ